MGTGGIAFIDHGLAHRHRTGGSTGNKKIFFWYRFLRMAGNSVPPSVTLRRSWLPPLNITASQWRMRSMYSSSMASCLLRICIGRYSYSRFYQMRWWVVLPYFVWDHGNRGDRFDAGIRTTRFGHYGEEYRFKKVEVIAVKLPRSQVRFFIFSTADGNQFFL